MIISHSQLQEVLRAYGGSIARTEKTGTQGRGKAVGPDKKLIGDSFTLSAQARELQRVKDLALRAPELRSERVKAVKKEIEDGTYDVSGEEIADKMLTRLLVDELV